MKLVLAEKPSVAQSIAKVLGAAKREDGYLEGNGYVVSWCVGHLVELAQPEVYDAKYSKWAYPDARKKFSCPAGSVTGVLSGGRGRFPLGRRVRHYRRRNAVRHRAAAGNQDPASQRPDLRPACRRKAGAQRGHRQGGSGKGHPRSNRPGCKTGTGRCPEKQDRGRPQEGLLDGISHLAGRKFWLARKSWYTHSCQSASQIQKMTI